MFAVIDGNIGAYKSTVLNIISHELGFIPVDEPWYENNFLDLFYQDKKRWAYSTQWEFFTIRAIRHMEAQNNTTENLLLERSVYSDRYVFARYLYDHGYMNDREWNSYTKWFDFLVEKLLKKPTFILYLRAKPETLYKRILQRSREIELQKDGISIDYIRGLNHYYDEFLYHNKFNLDIPIMVIDTDDKFYMENQDHRMELMGKIREFLKGLSTIKISS
ncbi:MAG: deoxynucleoside kinase [bacterium]|nr:deoxynucleoside kinase [bacterium]